MRRIQRGPVRGISLKLQVRLAGSPACSCALAGLPLAAQSTAEAAPGLQEEERERRMDYVPEESAVSTKLIQARTGQTQAWQGVTRVQEADGSASCAQVDPDTYDMLKTLNMSNLPGVEKVTVRLACSRQSAQVLEAVQTDSAVPVQPQQALTAQVPGFQGPYGGGGGGGGGY